MKYTHKKHTPREKRRKYILFFKTRDTHLLKHFDSMENVKCVVVGDGAVGKTSMLIAFTTGEFPTEYVPTVFDNYETELKVNGKEIYLGLWDTAGQEGYDRLRPLSYPQTDVFIISFAVNNPTSFAHIDAKWIPEIKHHCRGVPYIIVGTKADIRHDAATIKSLEDKGKKMKSLEEYQQAALELEASCYLECSSKEQDGLKKVFEEAVRIGIASKGDRKSSKKSLSKKNDSKAKKNSKCVVL